MQLLLPQLRPARQVEGRPTTHRLQLPVHRDRRHLNQACCRRRLVRGPPLLLLPLDPHRPSSAERQRLRQPLEAAQAPRPAHAAAACARGQHLRERNCHTADHHDHHTILPKAQKHDKKGQQAESRERRHLGVAAAPADDEQPPAWENSTKPVLQYMLCCSAYSTLFSDQLAVCYCLSGKGPRGHVASWYVAVWRCGTGKPDSWTPNDQPRGSLLLGSRVCGIDST